MAEEHRCVGLSKAAGKAERSKPEQYEEWTARRLRCEAEIAIVQKSLLSAGSADCSVNNAAAELKEAASWQLLPSSAAASPLEHQLQGLLIPSPTEGAAPSPAIFPCFRPVTAHTAAQPGNLLQKHDLPSNQAGLYL